MTGEAEWGLVKAPGGGMMGLQPLRRGADPDRELFVGERGVRESTHVFRLEIRP
jgi:hypothetical protein